MFNRLASNGILDLLSIARRNVINCQIPRKVNYCMSTCMSKWMEGSLWEVCEARFWDEIKRCYVTFEIGLNVCQALGLAFILLFTADFKAGLIRPELICFKGYVVLKKISSVKLVHCIVLWVNLKSFYALMHFFKSIP